MTQTKSIIALIIAALIIGGYYLYTGRPGASQAPSVLNPVSGQTVSDKIPETNPFQTNVNPFDSYKNPFD